MVFSFSSIAPEFGANRFRQARTRQFAGLVRQVLTQQEHCRILDIGGAAEYWWHFGGDLDWSRISLTVLNLEIDPAADAGPIRQVTGDARDMRDFAAGSFDIAHSNSVIEHVGRWDSMQRMADEVRRVAPRYFVQTPSYWFPLEAHARMPFFQFLPEPLRLHLLQKYKLGYLEQARDIGEASRILHSTFLLNWAPMAHLFPDAVIATERLLGLPKSYIAIKR